MKERERKSKYQDFVIKNGRLVGKFEEMFQKFSDPWKLLKKNKSGQFKLPHHTKLLRSD